MKAFAPGKMVRSSAGVLLALLACGILAPSQARAGCSHYAIPQAIQDELANLIDPLIAGEAQQASPTDSSPEHRPKPCTGPSCSGWPASPPVPPIDATKFVESWAHLEPFRLLPTTGSTLLVPTSCDDAPAHRGTSIFHPPRMIASSPIA
jgi:hypothetical protein